MTSLKHRLERLYEKEMTVAILQADGSVVRFSQQDAADAFARNIAILRAKVNGEEPPPLHPFQLAVKNAATPEPWHQSYWDEFKDVKADGSVMKVEDLAEP